MAKKQKKKRLLPLLIPILALCCALAGLIFVLRMRGEEEPAPAPDPTPAAASAEAVSPTDAPILPLGGVGGEADSLRGEEAKALRLSELMVKNHATLRDEDGDFSDWLELENCSAQSISMEGWRLSDKENGGGGWVFPAVTLEPGERLLVFASGKDRRESVLHTDFSLSADEWLSLRTPDGQEAFSLQIPKLEKDCSLIAADGGYEVCAWPTPGQSNDAAGYELWQQSQSRTSPLLISEAMSSNPFGVPNVSEKLDWVELQNVSGENVELGNFYLSDDRSDYLLWRLPERTLAPGQRFLLACDKEGSILLPCAPFSLNGERETLYLSTETELCDYVSLHDMPYLGSCGRVEGQNGFFYFASPTAGSANGKGVRRLSQCPSASQGGGLYDGVASLSVQLSAPGAIYYTLDGSYPDENGTAYTGPIEITETTILRAVCLEEDALPSRILTESYFLNEGHSLPVVSIVADDYSKFQYIYNNGASRVEIPGSVAFYEEDGSFRLGCGIKLSGATSLELPKKNISVLFRGAYGDSGLKYDIFDGGVDEFQSLTFRAGQDYYAAIIRNELLQNLALQFSGDHLVTQRSRYCVLYVNGNYFGIYALKDKINRDFYAGWAGVSKESVSLVRSPVPDVYPFYYDVFLYILQHDVQDPENYAHVCELLDVDSLIDWAIIEGYCTNTDIASGNLRYAGSTEGDGKWHAVLYDLDTGILRDFGLFYNLFSRDEGVQSQQVTVILMQLLRNPQFRARFLERLSEALYGPLSDKSVLAEMDRLYAQIESELPRDFARWWRQRYEFDNCVDNLRRMVTGRAQQAYDDVCTLLSLTEQEKETYFSKPFD